MKAILILSIVLFDPAATTTIREFPSLELCRYAMENIAVGYGRDRQQVEHRRDRDAIGFQLRAGFHTVGQVSISCSAA